MLKAAILDNNAVARFAISSAVTNEMITYARQAGE